MYYLVMSCTYKVHHESLWDVSPSRREEHYLIMYILAYVETMQVPRHWLERLFSRVFLANRHNHCLANRIHMRRVSVLCTSSPCLDCTTPDHHGHLVVLHLVFGHFWTIQTSEWHGRISLCSHWQVHKMHRGQTCGQDHNSKGSIIHARDL